MTNQEVFDKVATHLYKQGRPAVAGDVLGSCIGDGLSCAIGCLISDEDYSPQMESLGVISLGKNSLLPNNLIGMNLDFLDALQCAHDGNAMAKSDVWLSSVKNRLVRVAYDYGLSPAILDTLWTQNI